MNAIRKIDTNNAIEELLEKEMDWPAFDYFAKKMYSLAGVNLPRSPKNLSLVKNRIAKLLRRYQFVDYKQLIKAMETENKALLSDFVSALTTNKTNFFRESSHFDFFNQYLKTHFETHRDLRVWCAAASTGQEPYTISICMREALSSSQYSSAKLLATDIDLQVLDKAAKGIYSDLEMEGISPMLRQKYFEKKVADGESYYRAKNEIASWIRFAPFNLVNGSYTFQGKFHVIFCRNVLIYFDEKTTREVISKLTDQLVPGGFLLIGHSESGTVKQPNLKAIGHAIFQKTEGK